jgi:hypothetical protein
MSQVSKSGISHAVFNKLISPYHQIKCYDELFQSSTPCLHLLNTDKVKKMADINIDENHSRFYQRIFEQKKISSQAIIPQLIFILLMLSSKGLTYLFTVVDY